MQKGKIVYTLAKDQIISLLIDCQLRNESPIWWSGSIKKSISNITNKCIYTNSKILKTRELEADLCTNWEGK
jgi:hypothetical protein